MNLKSHWILKLFLFGMLLGLASCNSQGESKSLAPAAASNSLSSAPSDDALFNEDSKEGCTTEEDLEAKIELAAKAETVSLQGTTDPGCEVK